MSLFPALKPSARSLKAGTIPVSAFKSVSGKETRVILGDTPLGHSLSLSFSNVNETVAGEILAHWTATKGIALAFTLPADVWAGWTAYTAAVPSTQTWRYGGAPNVVAVSPSIMNVSVSLLSVI
tara:strand:- start:598 stop:969 length:372 start_codon:yes stop_codon:yes gene_type:complete